jgi:hypothetical protein
VTMQKYTRLKLTELRDRIMEQFREEQDKAASSWAARGFDLPSGGSFADSEDINMKHLDVFIDKIFSIEKAALQNDKATLDDEYFETSKDEFIKETEELLQVIFESRRGYTNSLMNGENIYRTYLDKYISRIRNGVDIMKEEIRLGITSNPGGTTINVGGDVGAINTGTVYNSVHGKIDKMRGTSAEEMGNTFEKLLDAIKESSIDETTKAAQMENVDFLVTQYNKPPQERTGGLISASLTLLSAAANLTTIWVKWGPMIIKAFNS